MVEEEDQLEEEELDDDQLELLLDDHVDVEVEVQEVVGGGDQVEVGCWVVDGGLQVDDVVGALLPSLKLQLPSENAFPPGLRSKRRGHRRSQDPHKDIPCTAEIVRQRYGDS